MKLKKNLSLTPAAIAQGEALAVEQGLTFSTLVEKTITESPRVAADEPEDYWSGPALKPLRRTGEARHDYLTHKHA